MLAPARALPGVSAAGNGNSDGWAAVVGVVRNVAVDDLVGEVPMVRVETMTSVLDHAMAEALLIASVLLRPSGEVP